MQVKKTGKVVAKRTLVAMPKAMAESLKDISINDAIEMDLITSVGNDTGGLIFKNKTATDKYYAIINGYAIQTSSTVGDGSDVEDLGALVFHTGESQERYLNGEESEDPKAVHVFWARLGVVRGINLEAEATATFSQVEA